MEPFMANDRLDVHQTITEEIIALLERCPAGSFELPWRTAGGLIARPRNVITGHGYRGVNILSLWAAAYQTGYASGVWGTYRQWTRMGAQVRRGEKASHVVIYKPVERGDEAENPTEDASSSPAQRMFARASAVFAAEQVNGYRPPKPRAIDPVVSCTNADALITASGAAIVQGGSRAFYRPSTDTIHIPDRTDFIGSKTSSATQSYYAVLLHELTHWTAHKDRCVRDLSTRFGDDSYAMEELVAELGSAFLCSELGISPGPRPDHAAYIASWLKVLRQDKRAIFTAASRASDAADFLTGHGRPHDRREAADVAA
jgi:antirestriction protein ArdC